LTPQASHEWNDIVFQNSRYCPSIQDGVGRSSVVPVAAHMEQGESCEARRMSVAPIVI